MIRDNSHQQNAGKSGNCRIIHGPLQTGSLRQFAVPCRKSRRVRHIPLARMLAEKLPIEIEIPVTNLEQDSGLPPIIAAQPGYSLASIARKTMPRPLLSRL